MFSLSATMVQNILETLQEFCARQHLPEARTEADLKL